MGGLHWEADGTHPHWTQAVDYVVGMATTASVSEYVESHHFFLSLIFFCFCFRDPECRLVASASKVCSRSEIYCRQHLLHVLLLEVL